MPSSQRTVPSVLLRAGTGTAALGLAVALAGCSGDAAGGASDGAESGEAEQITVVTSIDVYADLVEQIAGDTADVQPMVDNPAVDPHSYEATPQDRLAVDSADVIVANGGGYDAFLTRLAESAGKEDAVYQLIEGENEHSHGDGEEGEDHAHGEDEHSHEDEGHAHDDDHAHDEDGHSHEGGYENEHIWYDIAQMRDFVQDFGEHLAEEAPDNADLYRENAGELDERLAQLQEQAEAVDADGLGFLATESVSGFLLETAGFEDLTDQQFLAAVEHGDDVSPRLYQQALDTASGEEIGLLAYNPQTETSQSERIRAEAEDSGVEVMEFSETLPEGSDGYVDWMQTQIEDLDEAVERIDG